MVINMITMKSSGVAWLGEIPLKWDVVKIKYPLKERKESNNARKTNDILSLLKNKGVIPYSEKGNMGNKSKENIEDYHLAYPGDIVLNSMNVIIGSVGLSKYFGAISPVYYALNKRFDKDKIGYFNYIFQTKEFQRSLIGYGNGILKHRMRIRMIMLNKVMIPYPPEDNQEKIVNFLDYKISLIDEIILKNVDIIKKYKKYKQAIIVELVTKGLSMNVKMKKSEIKGIGKIPENWNIVKLKYIFSVMTGMSITKEEFVKEGIPCINYGDIHSKYNFDFIINRDEINSAPLEKCKGKSSAFLSKGDFLFCDTSEDLEGSGNCLFIRENQGKKIIAGSHTIIGKPKVKINSPYFAYLLKVPNIKQQIQCEVSGIKVYSITQSILKNIKLIVPKVEEQIKIAEILDKKTFQINSIIFKKEKLIEKLEVYKKSLVFEVVTGKREIN